MTHLTHAHPQITPTHIAHFKTVVGRESGVVTDQDELKGFTSDWMHKYHAPGSVVLRPTSTDQVSDLLKYCNDNRCV